MDDPSVVYDVHFYDPWDFTAGNRFHYGRGPAPSGGEGVFDRDWLAKELEEQILGFGRRHRVPLNIGEYGIKPAAEKRGGLDYLRDLTSLMDNAGVSRQMWCWHTYQGWAMDHSVWHKGHFPRRENVLEVLRRKAP